jgi:hypothetical protein
MKQYAKIILSVLITALAETSLSQTISLQGPQDVSQKVNVSVTIAKRAELEVIDVASAVYISTDDKRNGYVDLPKALSFKLWCNSKDGAEVKGQLYPLYYNSKQDNVSVKLLYRISGESNFREAKGALQDIYNSCQKERGKTISIDIRYKIDKNAPIGEYAFEASLLAEPK